MGDDYLSLCGQSNGSATKIKATRSYDVSAEACVSVMYDYSAKCVTFIFLTVLLQVHEGRNHEVRELVKNAGLDVSFDFEKSIFPSLFFKIALLLIV